MQKQKSGFTPLFLIFLITTRQIAWQGYGQVNKTVIDTVMDYINANISQHTGDSSYDAFNMAFSDELNRRWDPAWNVFTIVTISADDAICYGYAFRNQWMWYNDYRVNGVVLAFVIWKDYNCHTWHIVGKNGLYTGLGDTASIKSRVMQRSASRENLWIGAKTVVDDTLRKFGQVVSIMASQDSNSDIYGRVCAFESKVFYTKPNNISPFYASGGWGNALVFQTR